MAAKTNLNTFVSQAIISVTESAANTLTFQKLETGIAPLEKIGWVLERVTYRLSVNTLGFFNATGDNLKMGLTVSNQLTALNDTDPAVIAHKVLIRTDLGVAASGSFYDLEFVQDFSNLSGGGLLLLPNPVYAALVGTSLTTAATVVFKLYFHTFEMSGDDYFNLVQSRQVLINS